MQEKEFDFFISHASEDKETFVRPLAEKLSELGYKLWYDEFSLSLGDSLVQGISNGIKSSKYGIIVLSKNFFKKTWTKKELEALINKEVISDTNLILPIWLEISRKDVYEFSPLLIDKLAISVQSKDLDKAISEIKRKTGISITSIKMIQEKIDFLLSCNRDEKNKYFLDIEQRIKSIFYFSQELYNWCCSNDGFRGKEWDDLIFSGKDIELRRKYNLPVGIWHSSEIQPSSEMKRIIQLSKKWTNRTMTCNDVGELIFLVDEFLDSDLHYILYGFPHKTINSKSAYYKSFDGAYEVGMKKIASQDEREKAFNKAFKDYYYS